MSVSPYGHIGSFYFGAGSERDASPSYLTPNFEIVTPQYTQNASAVGYFVPAFIFEIAPETTGYTQSPFDLDFVAIPRYGTSPLYVTLSAFNYTPTNQYSNAWVADTITWEFDYSTSGSSTLVQQVTDPISTVTTHVYTGNPGTYFDVRAKVSFKSKV